ncbi:ATP-binding protein [Actinocorallia longicatena]|uniref:Histidine kinase/HSP90-like ATPase domain-containing protein n=1 Tax=Actinocorallia longicatena TaxID=111803 RepID=A0ABP6PXM2_9ACTN
MGELRVRAGEAGLAVGFRWVLPGDAAGSPVWAAELAGLTATGLGPDLVEDVRMVVGALVSNACRHSRSGLAGGLVTVSATVTPETMEVTVLDQGSEDVVGPRLGDEGQLGLIICSALGDLSVSGDAVSGWRVRVTLPGAWRAERAAR